MLGNRAARLKSVLDDRHEDISDPITHPDVVVLVDDGSPLPHAVPDGVMLVRRDSPGGPAVSTDFEKPAMPQSASKNTRS